MTTAFIIQGNVRSLNEQDLNFRRESLRSSVICIGITKIISVICYSGLFFAVYQNTKGDMAIMLPALVFIAIVLQILYGTILFLGALHRSMRTVAVSLWLCLITGSFNTMLGTVGALYYIRKMGYTLCFLLACIFICLSLSLFTALCTDFKIIYAYRISMLTPTSPVQNSGHTRTQVEEIKS